MKKRAPLPKDSASLKSELETLKLQISVGRARRVAAMYDAVEGSSGAAGTGNKRRMARVEVDSEDEQYPHRKRNLGINLAREVLRNYATYRGHIHQLRVNTVGPLGKLSVLTKEPFGKVAGDWFNSEWSESAEFRSGLPWGDVLQLTVSNFANEGDMVFAFDDGTITGGKGTGRILGWESDQITSLPAGDFARMFPITWTQDNGLIRDNFGREVGVIVTGKRGLSEVPASECFILRRDPMTARRDNWWVHVKRQFRLVQGRGVAAGLSSVALTMDAYELLAKHLQAAKKNSSIAAIIQREEAIEDFDDPAFDPTNPESAEGTAAVDPTTLPEKQTSDAENYDQIEAFASHVEYMDPRDKVTIPDVKFPDVNLPGFLDYVTDGGAQPFGLAHAYARMRADSSYTAFRGDMVMTWVSIKDNQKFIERNVADWGASHAIRWGIANGKITEAPPVGWERALAWQWPKMPEVDEQKKQAGIAAALKNGDLTYQDLIGPNWRERFDQLAEEIAYAREKNLPLSVLEMKSGGTAAEQKPTEGDQQ